MNNEKTVLYYQAFGLIIESEITIDMLSAVDDMDLSETADVKIKCCDLSRYDYGEDGWLQEEERIYFEVPEVARFLVEYGDQITVDIKDGVKDGLIAVYLLGSCMGAILYQRDAFLLHGSCVTDGNSAFLITGDSGAGKSSLASVFLKNGWKLVTDDVAMVDGIEEGEPVVHPSYPSQKLWQDAIERVEYQGELLSLYQEERREKYNVRVDAFSEKAVPLKMIVRLVPTLNDCEIEEVEGFARVDQIIRNTYRYYMLTEEQREPHFQRCVTLGSQLKMYIALRAQNRDTTEELYRKIIEVI